jgi:hypothetical protein
MTTLIEPPMIAIMEPLKVAQKANSDGVKNYGFSPPFGGELFSDFAAVVFGVFGKGRGDR